MRAAILILGVGIMTGTTTGAAQGTPESVTKGFAQVADWIQQSAESVPADKYSFKPTEGVRTFAQLVGHIIDGYHYYCALARDRWSGTTRPRSRPAPRTELMKQLAAATTECKSLAGGKLDPQVENLGHSNLHYGNMIVYLRLMGIVPASSR
jgi:uncharacterized damage-inducible protein DinB